MCLSVFDGTRKGCVEGEVKGGVGDCHGEVGGERQAEEKEERALRAGVQDTTTTIHTQMLALPLIYTKHITSMTTLSRVIPWDL